MYRVNIQGTIPLNTIFKLIQQKPLYSDIFAITTLFARSQKCRYRGVRLYVMNYFVFMYEEIQK